MRPNIPAVVEQQLPRGTGICGWETDTSSPQRSGAWTGRELRGPGRAKGAEALCWPGTGQNGTGRGEARPALPGATSRVGPGEGALRTLVPEQRWRLLGVSPRERWTSPPAPGCPGLLPGKDQRAKERTRARRAGCPAAAPPRKGKLRSRPAHPSPSRTHPGAPGSLFVPTGATPGVPILIPIPIPPPRTAPAAPSSIPSGMQRSAAGQGQPRPPSPGGSGQSGARPPGHLPGTCSDLHVVFTRSEVQKAFPYQSCLIARSSAAPRAYIRAATGGGRDTGGDQSQVRGGGL